jgi:hypothetical protein
MMAFTTNPADKDFSEQERHKTEILNEHYIRNEDGHEQKRRAANIYCSRGLASVSLDARANQRPDKRDARNGARRRREATID